MADEEIGGVSIPITADFSDLGPEMDRAIATAETKSNDIASAINSSLGNIKPPEMQGLQQAFQQTGQSAQEASGGIAAFSNQLLALGGISLTIEGLFNLGKAAIEASDQIDDARFALEKLTGDAAASQQMLEGLRALSDDEGLSFPVLVTAGQRLTAMLPAGTDVVGILGQIGNAAELMHTSIETASNKFRNLAESGSASVKSLGDLGIRFEDLDGAMRTLGVSADLLAEGTQKAFKVLGEHDRIVVLQEAMSRLDGVAKQMNDDIGGDSVRLMNQWHDTLVQLGDAIAPVARQALPALAEGLKAVVSAGAFLVSGLNVSLDAIVGFGSGLQSIIRGIGGAVSELAQGNFSSAINSLKGGLSDAAAANRNALDQMKSDIKSGSDFIAKIYATDVPASIKKTTDSLDGLGQHAKTAADGIASATAAVEAFDAKVNAGGSIGNLQKAFENASKSIDILAKSDLPAAIKAVDDYTAAQERNGAGGQVILEAWQKESELIDKLAKLSLPQASDAMLHYIDTLGKGETPLGVWQSALEKEEAIIQKLGKESVAAASVAWDRLIEELQKGHAPLSVLNKALEDHIKFLEEASKKADTAQAALIKLAQVYSDINTKGHDATQVFKDAADTLDRLGVTAAKAPQPLDDVNRALSDAGVSAQKAKNAFEDLSTPIQKIISDLDAVAARARNTGDWSDYEKVLESVDKRFQQLSKVSLPQAVTQLEAVVQEMIKAGAPADLIQQEMTKLGSAIQKMASEQLPGAQAAWDRYIELLRQVPSAIQDIQKAQEQQIQKDQEILEGLQKRGAAYGYILDQQAKLLQQEIAYAEKTGQDANNLVLGLEKVKLEQEKLRLETHGLADEYVAMINDVLKGFDQIAGAMAGAIIDGKNVGEALVGVFKNIGKSILTDVIQAALIPLKLALIEMISGLLPGMSAGLSIVGGGLTGLNVSAGAAATGLKALAAAAQEAAAEIQASSATAAGGGTGGGGMASTIGAIGAVVAAGAAVASAILLGHISSDTGHIEVNTREAEAELRNVRADAWQQFNQTYDRIGEILNAAYSIRDAVQQFNAAGGGIGQRAQDDLDSMAADLQFLRNISSPALMGGLSTIAQDIVTLGSQIMTDLDVIVQRLGQLVTNGLTANASMADIASDADVAAAASAIGDAIAEGSDQTGTDLTAMAGSIGSAIIDSGNHIATITDSRLQQAIEVAQRQYAAAHDSSEQLNALRAEYQANEKAMEQAERNYEQALRDGNQELAGEYKAAVESYRQALLNLQGQITPLLSAEVTYTRDAALAEGQLASTLPKEIAGVGMAATGAGNLVAAHVDAAAVTIGTAVIAQGAFMQAAAAAILSAAASMGKAGAGNVYGGGPGGSSGTPTTGPGSPGYGQAQQPSGPTTGTGGFGGTVAKPSTNAPGAPSSASTPYNSPNKGSTGVYVSDPNALPMFATGGEVVKGGIAFVDQGEIVQPAEKGSSPDYAGILRDAMQIDAQLQRLVDQVSSQQAWIAQMAANGAPPAMMELLQKQLEGYQKALTLYEVQMGYAKQTADNTAGLPALHPQPVGTHGTPLPVDLPAMHPQPVGTQGHPLPGTNEFPHLPTDNAPGGSKLTPAQIIGSPEYIAALAAAASAAATAVNGPSGGGVAPTDYLTQNSLDPRTIGFYAGTLAELEDIRNTIHHVSNMLSSGTAPLPEGGLTTGGGSESSQAIELAIEHSGVQLEEINGWVAEAAQTLQEKLTAIELSVEHSGVQLEEINGWVAQAANSSNGTTGPPALAAKSTTAARDTNTSKGEILTSIDLQLSHSGVILEEIDGWVADTAQRLMEQMPAIELEIAHAGVQLEEINGWVAASASTLNDMMRTPVFSQPRQPSYEGAKSVPKVIQFNMPVTINNARDGRSLSMELTNHMKKMVANGSAFSD
jgi:hypothetical protein